MCEKDIYSELLQNHVNSLCNYIYDAWNIHNKCHYNVV